MESAKQRIRAAAARQKAEKRAQEAEGEASSTPKASTKQVKRKPDGSDRRQLRRPPSLLALQRKNHLPSQAIVRVKGQ